jgi:tripartite-type tricarboxylate transporter receptor subunit TctC
MKHVLNLVIAAALALPVAAAGATAPTAVPYPVKVVTLVTHSSPGSGSDVVLREQIKYFQRYINATFIVENDEGGSGAKAVSRVAAARPDGSMLYASTPTYVLTSLMSRPPNTYKDLEPLVNFFNDSEVVYTRVESPYKTLKDVLDHARTARGRWGVSNPASLERESAEELKISAKVNAAIVPHDGGADMMINVLNGTLDIGIGEIEEIRAQLEAKKIRPLATFNAERIAGYPDVPTVKESGYNIVLTKFRGLAAPKGISPAVVKIWNDAAQKVLNDPEYKKSYTAENLAPNFMAHDQYGPFVVQFADDTAKFLKSTGVIR